MMKKVNIATVVDKSLKDFAVTHCEPRIAVTAKIKNDISRILERLDDVKVNGATGLEASLRDLYGLTSSTHGAVGKLNEKLEALLLANETNLAFKGWVVSTKKLFGLIGFKSKTGKFLFWIILFIAINTVLHGLGINLDAGDIIKNIFNLIIRKGV
jgi:hypothetical protein